MPQVGHPRRLGVSSFGIGGTNAHMCLEEYTPAASEDPLSTTHRGARSRSQSVTRSMARSRLASGTSLELLPNRSELLVVSARSPWSLEQNARRLAGFLAQESRWGLPLSDIAHTLFNGREAWEHRVYL